MKFIQNPKKQFLFFLVLFFIVNLIQSYTTGLLDDESYYWVWSKQLDFGYFDHPPLVALWIKISSFFFEGLLGVRLFSAFSFSLMLILIWKCIDDQRKWNYVWLFFLLIISVALLNIYGFITVPDTPLVLFTALFLYAYKRFLEEPTGPIVFLLGIAMAGMLYSKYHGLLVIVFVLLSNLSLLKSKAFWLASVLGAFLFAPHLFWQFQEDFPSVKYHLFERGKKSYKFEYTLMHLVNLIAIVGLTFPIIYTAFFKQKIRSSFQKGLQYIVLGFMIFFFIASFKTSTQAQWNSVILIPLVILIFSYFIDHSRARKWLIRLGLANLVVMLTARVFLANSALSPIEMETHGGPAWAATIKEKTQGKPIVFKSSYKRASKYRFYTGISTHSYSTLKTRKSQYDLSDYEAQMQGKNVAVVGDSIEGYRIYKKGKHLFLGHDIEAYRSYEKLKCTLIDNELFLSAGESQKISFEIYNPYEKDISFENIKFVGVFQGKKNLVIKKIPLLVAPSIFMVAKSKKRITATINVPKKISDQVLTFRIGLQFYQLSPGFQGNKVTVHITK